MVKFLMGTPQRKVDQFTPQKVATKIIAFIDKAADEAQSKLSEKAKQDGVSYHHLKVSKKLNNAMLLTASDGVTVMIWRCLIKQRTNSKLIGKNQHPMRLSNSKITKTKSWWKIQKGTYDTQLTPDQKKQIEENLEKNTKDLDQWYETPAFYLGILGLVGLIAIPQIVGMVRRTR